MLQYKILFLLSLILLVFVGCTSTSTSLPEQQNPNITETAIASQKTNDETIRLATFAPLQLTNAALNILQTEIALENTRLANIATEMALNNIRTQLAQPTARPPSSTPIPNTATPSQQPTSETQTSNTPTPASQPTRSNNIIFEDDFSNNNNGWSLIDTENGFVNISQGQLALTPSNLRCLYAPLPVGIVNREFYAETQVTVNRSGITMGLAIGPNDGPYFVTFGTRMDGFRGIWTGTYKSISDASEILNPKALFREKEPFALGLELISGQFGLYIAGEEPQWSQHDAELGGFALVACDTFNRGDGIVYFDNLSVRTTK